MCHQSKEKNNTTNLRGNEGERNKERKQHLVFNTFSAKHSDGNHCVTQIYQVSANVGYQDKIHVCKWE